MSDNAVDQGKRTWLITTSCAGAVGGVAAAVPFVSTFAPSERAKAAGAPVEVDISGLKPGEKMTVEWRGKPVWVVRRTPEQLAELPKNDPQLADPNSDRKAYPIPDYAKNESRSIKPEYFRNNRTVPLRCASNSRSTASVRDLATLRTSSLENFDSLSLSSSSDIRSM